MAAAPVETDSVRTVLVAPSMAGAERWRSIAKVRAPHPHVEAVIEVTVSVLTAPAAPSMAGAELQRSIAKVKAPHVEAAIAVTVSVLTALVAPSMAGAELRRPIAVQPLPLDLIHHLQLLLQQEAARSQSPPLLELSPSRTFRRVSIATIHFKVVISAPPSQLSIKSTV